MRIQHVDGRYQAALLLCALIAGCADGALPTTTPDTARSATAQPTTGATAMPSEPAVASQPTIAEPPDAALASDGGDPVTGQLGTYLWGEGGSDVPWLPGSPVLVGAGEPLTVTFEPVVGIAGWSARYVPAGSIDPSGATALGSGSGAPSFAAPSGGQWTVEVAVGFADGQGSASYFWRLDVE